MIESDHIKLWLEDGILFIRYAENLAVDLEMAREIVAMRLAFSEGKSYPVLADIRGLRSATKAARDYLACEGIEQITAGALLVENPLSKLLGNLFLVINRPKVPSRLFTSESAAREWLKEFSERKYENEMKKATGQRNE